jgi:hypothetical protein
MPTPKKIPSKKPPSPAARKSTRPPPAKPFLRFYHSEALRAETLAVLTAIEEAQDPLKHRDALADLAARLVDAGMDYYFLRALRHAKVGFVVEQSATIASAGASRVLATVIRNVLTRMDRTHLLAVSAHMRHLME